MTRMWVGLLLSGGNRGNLGTLPKRGMMASISPMKPAVHKAVMVAVKPGREMMLGGMFDSDVQSRWRDTDNGARDPHSRMI